MSSHTRSRYVRSRAPFSLLGVPTHIREKAASPTAAAASVVARNRPAATTSRTSAASPGSTTGLQPRLIRSTFVSLTSTPMTPYPAFARQAAETQPTYPSPKTPMVGVMLARKCGAFRHHALANRAERRGSVIPTESRAHRAGTLFAQRAGPVFLGEQTNCRGREPLG